MTSVQFHIDPRARGGPSMRVLHGRNADDYERQRERSRRSDQNEAGAEGRGAAFAMELMDRNAPQQIGQRGAARPGGSSAAARFVAMGGRQLDLDSMDYEELHAMFPSHARQGVTPSVLEQCSNVFKFHPTTCGESLTSCSICLVDYEVGDDVRMLPCLHAYHKACADEWLKCSHSCPVCKTNIRTLVADTPRITGKENRAPLQQERPAPPGRVMAAVERFGAAAERAINSLRGSSSSPRRGPAGGRQREGGRREEEFPSNRDPRLGLNNQEWRRLRLEDLERARQRQRELAEEQEAAAALTDEVDVYRQVLEQHRRAVYMGRADEAGAASPRTTRMETIPERPARSSFDGGWVANMDMQGTGAGAGAGAGQAARAGVQAGAGLATQGAGAVAGAARSSSQPSAGATSNPPTLSVGRQDVQRNAAASSAAQEMVTARSSVQQPRPNQSRSALERAAAAMAAARTPENRRRSDETLHEPSRPVRRAQAQDREQGAASFAPPPSIALDVSQDHELQRAIEESMREQGGGVARVMAGGAGRVVHTPRRAQEERRSEARASVRGASRQQEGHEVRAGVAQGMDFDLQRAIQESMEDHAFLFEGRMGAARAGAGAGRGRDQQDLSRQSRSSRAQPDVQSSTDHVRSNNPPAQPATSSAVAAAGVAAAAMAAAPAPPAPAPSLPPAPPDGRISAVLNQLTRPASSDAPRRASSPEALQALAAFQPRPPPPARRQGSRGGRPLPGVRASHPEPLQRGGGGGGVQEEQGQTPPAAAHTPEAMNRQESSGEQQGFAGGGRGYVLGRANSAAERMYGGGEGVGEGQQEGGGRSGTPPLLRRGLSEREKRAIAAERRLAMMHVGDASGRGQR